MVTVTVSKLKTSMAKTEKVGEEKFEYFIDEDLNEFVKNVTSVVFAMSEDSDEVLVYYRYINVSNIKTHSRRIISNSIRHIINKTIIGSRIESDMIDILKPPTT